MLRLILLLTAVQISLTAASQSPYQVTPDPKHPEKYMLVGLISPYILQNDASFSWFENGQKGYQVPGNLNAALQAASEKLFFIVFAGTWCEDSHFIIPRYFKALQLAGFPDERVVFYALDRNKKMPGKLTAALGITNVPTIIVMKDGKEAGRVVEYGKTGNWEEELAGLIK